MTKLLQTLLDGISVGSLYALIALGYTMVYGVLQFINFAHGDVFMCGAWFAFLLATWAGVAAAGTPLPDAPAVPSTLWMVALIAGMTGLALWLLARRARRWNICRPQPMQMALVGVEGLGLLARSTSLLALLLAGGVWLTWLAGRAAADAPYARLLLVGPVLLLLVMALCAVLGYTVERVAYQPLRNAPRINALITAIAVSLALQRLGQMDWLFGTQPRRMPTIIPDTIVVTLADVPVRLINLITVGTALVLMGGLELLIYRSRLGLAMRAVSSDRHTALLMGVPADRIVSITFVAGSALAAAAGLLYANTYPGINQPAHATWILLGLKAFVAAVVGGIGSVRGAMVGGLLIGLIEFFGAAYLSPSLRDVYVFALLIAVLLIKPTGLFGCTVLEKV